MRTKNIQYALILFVSLIWTSCKEQKINNFKLTILINENIGEVQGEPMNNSIKSLCNYYEDTSCSESLFVPEVEIIRTDISSEKKETFSIPLSSLNDFRKSMNLLSAVNLKEDYDENISKVLTSEYLGSVTNKPLDLGFIEEKYPNCFIILYDDSVGSRINFIKNKIVTDLCKNNSNKFTILIYRPNTSPINKNKELTKNKVKINKNRAPVIGQTSIKQETDKIESDNEYKRLEILLNDQSINWPNNGTEYSYKVIVKKYEGVEKIVFESEKINSIDISSLKIKDNQLYEITVSETKSGKTKTTSKIFNLINAGTKMNPSCKSKNQ